MEKRFVICVKDKYLEQILNHAIAEAGYSPISKSKDDLNNAFEAKVATLLFVSLDFVDKGLWDSLAVRREGVFEVAVACPISQVDEAGKLVEMGMVDYPIVEPVRSEVVASVIRSFLKGCALHEEIVKKEGIIDRLETENAHLRMELEKLVPREKLRKSIPYEVYKRVSSERGLFAKAYERNKEESSS